MSEDSPTTTPQASAFLEADLAEVLEGRHSERRILLGIYKALIDILKALEAE